MRDEPTRFSHYSENVPDELKTGAPAWVCCDEVKVPLVAVTSGACYAASSTDPTTWRSYEDAVTAWRENEWSFAGIGRVITLEEAYVGVDIDDVRDPDTGELAPRAFGIIERLDSYSEISPSLTGVKVWLKAPSVTRAHVKAGLEVYPRARYLIVTGLVLRDTEIAVRDDEIAAIIEEEFPKVDRDRTPYDGPKRVIDLLEYLERASVEISRNSPTARPSASTAYVVRGLTTTPTVTSPGPTSGSTLTARRFSSAGMRTVPLGAGKSSRPTRTPLSIVAGHDALQGGCDDRV